MPLPAPVIAAILPSSRKAFERDGAALRAKLLASTE